jgi:predicted Zn-dependent protease
MVCGAILAVFVVQRPQCGEHRYDHPQLALEALQVGRYDQALLEVRRSLREGADTPGVRLIAAMAHLAEDRVEEAVTELGAGLAVAPDDSRLHQTLREVSLQARRVGLADTVLQGALRRHPESTALLTALGWAATEQGQDQRAAELLARAVERSAGDPAPRVELARLHLSQERFGAAVEVAQEGLRATPDDPHLLLVLGEGQLRLGRLAEADTALAQAVHLGDSEEVLAGRVAQLYYDAGHRRQAIRYYEAALAAGPQRPSVLNNLAWSMAEEGVRLDEALELASRAVKLDPDNPVFLDTYAEVNFRLGRPARAAAVIRRALDAEPVDGEHRLYLEQQLARFTGIAAAAGDR